MLRVQPALVLLTPVVRKMTLQTLKLLSVCQVVHCAGASDSSRGELCEMQPDSFKADEHGFVVAGV